MPFFSFLICLRLSNLFFVNIYSSLFPLHQSDNVLMATQFLDASSRSSPLLEFQSHYNHQASDVLFHFIFDASFSALNPSQHRSPFSMSWDLYRAWPVHWSCVWLNTSKKPILISFNLIRDQYSLKRRADSWGYVS